MKTRCCLCLAGYLFILNLLLYAGDDNSDLRQGMAEGTSWYFVLADNSQHRIYFVHAEKALKDGTIADAIQFVFNPVNENYSQITENINGLTARQGLGIKDDKSYYCYNNVIRAFDKNGHPGYVYNIWSVSTGTHVPHSLHYSVDLFRNLTFAERSDTYIYNNGQWQLNWQMYYPADKQVSPQYIIEGYDSDFYDACGVTNGTGNLRHYDTGCLSSRGGCNSLNNDLSFLPTGMVMKRREKPGYQSAVYYVTDSAYIYEVEQKSPVYYDGKMATPSELYVLRTISAENLNLSGITIMDLTGMDFPSMQIWGNPVVDIGQSTQLRTVGVLPITWVVGDDTRAVIDGNGLLRGMQSGVTIVIAIDALKQTAIKLITIN